jgi:hypothetical protein
MGALLLSIASPETISWAGFVMLIVALMGEAFVFFIPPSREKLHKELAFGFAILAAAGVAVETIGNDAIVEALQHRADAAETSLKQINGPRDITASEHSSLVNCLKNSPNKGIVHIVPGWVNGDARQIGDQIAKIFEEAGGFDLKPSPIGENLSWSSPGIFLVVTDLKHAPAHATNIQKCFFESGRKVYGFGDPKHAPDTVTIGIGAKF